MSKRNLKEAVSTIEVGISKCLCGSRLSPVELDEMRHLTYADLMTDHGLDSLMAEQVKLHVQNEVQRETYQSYQTWQPDSRDIPEGPAPKASYTNPIRENFELEDIMDLDSHHDDHTSSDHGRMLDYGHVKSDSHEGRMMRQALHEIGKYANDLHEMLTDDDDLPQWCHYKVAVARACVGKVKHYLEYKIAHPKQK